MKWVVRFAISSLIIAGLWTFGSGLWIFLKAELAQVLLEHSFERSVVTGQSVKPWSWADTAPLARIQAKRLGKSSVILNGASGQALAFGPGHLSDTPYPGERGTAVLAGHRDTHFTWIKELFPGDELQIEMIDGSKLTYAVRRAWIARYDQAGIDAAADEHLIALTTCFPFDSIERGDRRYIVEAVQTEKQAATDIAALH